MREDIKNVIIGYAYEYRSDFDDSKLEKTIDEVIKIVREAMVNRKQTIKLGRIVADENFIRTARSIPKPKER